MKVKLVLHYQEGDYVTGVDQSMPRSIYQFMGYSEEKSSLMYKLIAFKGTNYSSFNKLYYYPTYCGNDYRKATLQDLLEKGAISKSVYYLRKLGERDGVLQSENE